jgi:hypothetical protein
MTTPRKNRTVAESNEPICGGDGRPTVFSGSRDPLLAALIKHHGREGRPDLPEANSWQLPRWPWK